MLVLVLDKDGFSFSFPDKLSPSLSVLLPQCCSCVRRCISDGKPPAPHLPHAQESSERFWCWPVSLPGLVLIPPDPVVRLPDQPPTTSMSVSVVAAIPLLPIVVVCAVSFGFQFKAHDVQKSNRRNGKSGIIKYITLKLSGGIYLVLAPRARACHSAIQFMLCMHIEWVTNLPTIAPPACCVAQLLPASIK